MNKYTIKNDSDEIFTFSERYLIKNKKKFILIVFFIKQVQIFEYLVEKKSSENIIFKENDVKIVLNQQNKKQNKNTYLEYLFEMYKQNNSYYEYLQNHF